MTVLQAYQADLLKDLDKGQGLSPDEVAELRRTTDLALRATKQAATAMGRSMAAMVVTERHLWGEPGRYREEKEGLSARCSGLAFWAFRYLRWEGSWQVREAKARSAANPSRLVPLPCLRVGVEGGAGQREVGKTWGGDPDKAFSTLSSGPE